MSCLFLGERSLKPCTGAGFKDQVARNKSTILEEIVYNSAISKSFMLPIENPQMQAK